MIQITIQSVPDADFFQIKKYPAEFFDAKSKAYELSRSFGNEDSEKITVTGRNVHNAENLFTNVAVEDIEVDGETYDTYEELSAVLTPILFKKGGGSGGGGTTGDYIPRLGTDEDKPVIGDVVLGDTNQVKPGIGNLTSPLKDVKMTMTSSGLLIQPQPETAPEVFENPIGAYSGTDFTVNYPTNGNEDLIFPQIKDTKNRIASVMSYTTDEIKTLGTWDDGKPIYRKVIEGSSTSGNFGISLTDLNIDKPVKFDAYNLNGDSEVYQMEKFIEYKLFSVGGGIMNIRRRECYFQPSYISASSYSDAIASDFSRTSTPDEFLIRIIIEYTKTTDVAPTP